MKIGDIKIDRLYKKYIWAVCIDCGKERWVRVFKDKPEYISCHKCATLRAGNNPVILYPNRSLKEAYIQDYGKDLENHYDVVENTIYSNRIFCMDCPHHCLIKWRYCPIRIEALEIMKEE